MDSKIIALIAGSVLLTGCMTAKVERLHANTKQLSIDVDSYVAMSNRIIEQKKKQEIKSSLDDINEYIRTNQQYIKQDKSLVNDTLNFNLILKERYTYHSLNEIVKEQNKYLSDYFKTLPLLLEKQETGDSIHGLVNNIDILNQVIEKNITIADEYKGRLKPNEASLIESILSNGFKIHQYETFKHAIDSHYDVILSALNHQRTFIYTANTEIFEGLNKNFLTSQKLLADSFKNQHTEASKLSELERRKINYKEDDFKKFLELTNKPFVLVRTDVKDKSNDSITNYRSQAYLTICSKKMVDESEEKFGTDKTGNDSFELPFEQGDQMEVRKYKFDIEKLAKIKGDAAVCELIDIIGLLKEKKYDQIESKSLNKSIISYNKLIELVDKNIDKK